MKSEERTSLGTKAAEAVEPFPGQSQSSELEALRLFASGFCHDISNALGAALGFVEMVREDIPSQTDAHQDLGGAVDSLERAIAFVGQFRAICREGRGSGRVGVPLIPLLKEFGKRLGCGQRGRGGRWLELPEGDLVAWSEVTDLYEALGLLFPGWPDDGQRWEWSLSLSRGRPPAGENPVSDEGCAVFRLSLPDPGARAPLDLAALDQAWRRLGGGASVQEPGLLETWLPLAKG